MNEPERAPEHGLEEEAEGPLEMKVRRRPEEEIEEAPTAEVVEQRRLREFNPSVVIAAASTAAAVLMVAAVAVWAPIELSFVVPWMLGSLTVLGIGLGVTATIGCRRRR